AKRLQRFLFGLLDLFGGLVGCGGFGHACLGSGFGCPVENWSVFGGLVKLAGQIGTGSLFGFNARSRHLVGAGLGNLLVCFQLHVLFGVLGFEFLVGHLASCFLLQLTWLAPAFRRRHHPSVRPPHTRALLFGYAVSEDEERGLAENQIQQ